MTKRINIYGEGHVEPYLHRRTACRALILRGSSLLVSNESASSVIRTPGGGMFAGEKPEDCVIREVREETGYIIQITKEFLLTSEYYERTKNKTHYYVCDIIGEAECSLTPEEAHNKLVPLWIEASELQDFFKTNSKDMTIPTWKRRMYHREHIAVTEFLKLCKDEIK